MKNQNCIDTILPPSTPLPAGLPPWIIDVFRRLRRWVETWRQRRQLARLDDRMLRDIGISRADARAEVEKPFWHL